MPTIPYVKAGAPFADSAGASGTFNAAKANTIDNGVYESMLQPAVRVYHNAAQSLASSSVTWTSLAFNSERFDQAGGAADTQHDTVTNNSRLTCKYAGVYLIGGSIEFASNATGTRWLRVYLNNATVIDATDDSGTLTPAVDLSITTLYALAVNDYVELQAMQNSGGNLNVTASSNYSPEFWMVRVA